MAIRLYKAYTPGTRNRTVSTFGEITKKKTRKITNKKLSLKTGTQSSRCNYI